MKTVIEMAKQAGIEWDLIDEDEGRVWYITQAGLERFAEIVRADEREACAKLAANYGPSRPIVSKNPSTQIVGRWEGEQAASTGIEAAIRARGNT